MSNQRNLATAIMTAAVVSGTLAVALFVAAPPGTLRVMRPAWPEAGVLWWDAALSLAFFLQHSGMVRRCFRASIAGFIPPPYHRAIYAIASGLVLTLVLLLWQPSETRLLTLQGIPRLAAKGAALLAVAGFAWGAFSLRNVDLFGLAPVRAYLRGATVELPPFVVRGPFRWVRHPWYFCAIVLIWSYPEVTSDRLLFNVLWTAWIAVGARLEEADLASDFGAVYDDYRRRVPMLIPWRGPAAL